MQASRLVYRHTQRRIDRQIHQEAERYIGKQTDGQTDADRWEKYHGVVFEGEGTLILEH